MSLRTILDQDKVVAELEVDSAVEEVVFVTPYVREALDYYQGLGFVFIAPERKVSWSLASFVLYLRDTEGFDVSPEGDGNDEL